MMIAGFEMPNSGKIFIDNEMIVFKPPFKRNIGMVFQNYALFPHMTVFNNIAFPLKMRGMKKKEIAENVTRALELVKLLDYGDRYPMQLSGGQQQRIALARAIVYNPPVLLMDEPLGALDKKLREHMQLEIMQLHKSLGITVIYVTHDQSEALTMSDRIALMDNGHIEQIGSPTNLYEEPRNNFVADFIGDTNLIMEADVVEERNGQLQILTSKGLVLFVPKPTTEIGGKVNVAIRPERIKFIESLQKKTHVFKGKVAEKIYLGNALRYKIMIDEKESVFVMENNDQYAGKHNIGDQVLLGWNDEDINLV
ncbi:MAG: ABC transporter ATP-binding protein [bacterium]|nr:MAG: ABC transporter ATP-binding protein [bacterium]